MVFKKAVENIKARAFMANDPYFLKVDFKNLQPNIADAIKESCPTADAIIYKIADEVDLIKTVTVEPGVEIARGLSMIIDTTIKGSVRLGCDLSVITQGILIGAFRSRPIQLEAHKTIRLLVQEILGAVFNCKGDMKNAVDGILGGIAVIAKEHKLNAQEALIVAKEDIKEALAKYTPPPKRLP